ncbi:oligosaccharide flippase family protein [Aquibacillus albus]|uniref:O-antigen/teichoic acid export membrane protein n=1 Tax=Aquibacillus albus TaxID=1168171 RepID=A0ABS2MZS2_9BACI|nr:O-antigen/teichoic acid export membrane protein [Aquibacillus albus]
MRILFAKTPDIFKGSAISFFLKVTSFILGYILHFLIAKIYGASSVGIYSIIQTLINIFVVLSVMGLDTTSLRLISQYKDGFNTNVSGYYYKRITIFILFSSSVVTSLVLAISPVIKESFFGDINSYIPIIVVAIAIPFMSLLKVTSESFKGFNKVKSASLFIFVLVPLFNIIFIVILDLINSNGYLMPLITYLCSLIISSLLCFYFLLKYLYRTRTESKTVKNVSYRSLLKISLPMLVTSSMLLIMSWTDILMIGYFMNTNDVGIYSIAVKVATITSFTLTAVNTISAPKFSELFWKKEIIGLKKIVETSSKLIFLSSTPILFFIFFFSKDILSLFGKEFIGGWFVLIILGMGQFINSITGSVGYLLNMTGNQKVYRNIAITSALCNILLNFILIPLFGLMGAAIATAFSTALLNIGSTIQVKRIFGWWTIYIPFINLIKKAL